METTPPSVAPNGHGFPFSDSIRVNLGNGRNCHVRIAGSGPPLLLLHGYPLDNRMWNQVVEMLAGEHLCIAPDLRGFGLNAEERFSFQIKDLANDCARLLDAKSIRQPLVVCGLSMGGYVALEFASEFSNRLSALILTNTRANSDEAPILSTRRSTAAKALTTGTESVVSPMLEKLLAPQLLRSHETSAQPVVKEVQQMMLDTKPSTIAWAQLAMAERKDFLETLKDWKIPILAIAGDSDPITPADALRTIVNASGSTNSRFCLIPDSAHLTPMEQPDLFVRSIRDFLQSLG